MLCEECGTKLYPEVILFEDERIVVLSHCSDCVSTYQQNFYAPWTEVMKFKLWMSDMISDWILQAKVLDNVTKAKIRAKKERKNK